MMCVLFVCCSLFVVRCLLLVGRRALSVAGCGMFLVLVVCCSSVLVYCFLFDVWRLVFGVW